MNERAETIDQVIAQLDDIIAWARDHDSRLGYFAALYRKVTRAVGAEIQAGSFDDNLRMERLDVLFANRYLDAYHAHRQGEAVTRSWAAAFAAADNRRPTVIQHLLLGMNAHINLDLGIAAAQLAPGDELPALRADFLRINRLLADLVGDVQQELIAIWPWLGLLLRFVRHSDDIIVNFSMGRARDQAWTLAQTLATAQGDQALRIIGAQDERVATRANLLLHPGVTGSAALLAIRLGERGSPATITSILE
jgi:hypothetical protein